MKGLPKTKRCNSVAVTVSVRFRIGFGVYVKQPLRSSSMGVFFGVAKISNIFGVLEIPDIFYFLFFFFFFFFFFFLGGGG